MKISLLNFFLAVFAFFFLSVSGLFINQFGEYSFSSLLLSASILVPAAIGLLLLFSTTRSTFLRINIICTIFIIFVVCFSVESLLQLGLIDIRRPAQDHAQPEFDKRSVAEVVRDMRKMGREAYPAIFPIGLYKYQNGKTLSRLDDFLPLGGLASVTTVYCNETGKYLIYNSDEFGFHNPSGIWSQSPVDIVAVGDSHTQGACVESDKNFIALIRKRYPRTVTLGMSSNGPLTTLASIREYVPHLKPKVVLWFYTEENDISEDLPVESNSPLLMQYVNSDFTQRLYHRQSEIDQRLKAFLNTIKSTPSSMNRPPSGSQFGRINFGDLIFLRSLRNSLHILVGPKRQYVNLFKTIINKARDTVEGGGGQFIVINLPSQRRYANAVGRFFQDLRRDRVFSVLDELEISTIDMDEIFSTEKDPNSNYIRHFNNVGSAKVAAEVLKNLEGKLN